MLPFERHHLVGFQHQSLAGDEPAGNGDASFEQSRREQPVLLLGHDIEFRAQHLDVAGVCPDDEGMFRIVHHLEPGFAVDLHAALTPRKERRIAKRRSGVEPYRGAVLQRQADALSVRHGDRQQPLALP